MQVAQRDQLRQTLHGRRVAIAGRWHRAIAHTGFVPFSFSEAREHLLALVDRAIDLLLADKLDRQEAQALGTAIAALYYAHPDALSHTQDVLARELLNGLTPEDRLALQPRLTTLMSELAAGFLDYARRTILAEQESIRGALLTARRQAQDALHASEARFRAVFDASAIGMGIGDMEGRILEVNPALERMLGYAAAEMRRMIVSQFMHPADAASVWELYGDLISGQADSFETEKRYFRKDGATIWCHLTVSLVRDAEGRPEYQIAMMENVTERVNAEEALRRSEARFRALVQNASDVVTIVDANGRVLYESPALLGMLGYSPQEMIGTDVFSLIHPEDLPRIHALFAEALARPGATIPAEFRFQHQDGTWRWLEAIGTNLIDDPAVGGVVVNTRDITERKAFEARLEHQAQHDPLTGLPNRVLLLDRLSRALATAEEHALVAVLFLDLDGFKLVNDSLGHEAGDHLLMAVGQRLQAALPLGAILARFGGDEFAVLLDGVTGANEPVRIARDLLAALRAPFDVDGRETFVTAAVGISNVTCAPEANPSDVIREADTALYEAKSADHAPIAVYERSMRPPLVERLERKTALALALERGELRLYYQPVVELATGRVVGAEALVRWPHPELGVLNPADFIGLAEDTGLIVPLGAWVVREACAQASAWQGQRDAAAPSAVPSAVPLISVNLSARQLLRTEVVTEVTEALRTGGLDPHALELEVTESVAMSHDGKTRRILRAFHDLGVRLAIDDFGTGCSSLAYLRELPFDALKIDRTFVGGLGRDPGSLAIIRATATLAHDLGLSVTAEGVETVEQARTLRQLPIDRAQGYYFSRPLPGAAAMLDMLAVGLRLPGEPDTAS
jgi:diguanylate cyclase (GGDEF)-like protein/PAS domain S-box-containing protein